MGRVRYLNYIPLGTSESYVSELISKFSGSSLYGIELTHSWHTKHVLILLFCRSCILNPMNTCKITIPTITIAHFEKSRFFASKNSNNTQVDRPLSVRSMIA